MSINPIELLKEKVSSTILDNQDGFLGEKTNALSKFYPILLSLLAAKPDLIGQLKNSLAPSLSDLFSHNDQIKNTVLTHLSGTAPSAEIESTLNSAINLVSIQFLKLPEVIKKYCELFTSTCRNNSFIFTRMGSWTIGTIRSWCRFIISNDINCTPLAAATETTGKSRGILPIIALIILGLLIAWLWRSCQHKEATPVPETSPASGVATAAAAPATLTLSTDDKGAVSQCQAGIGDQGFLATLQTQVKKFFQPLKTVTSIRAKLMPLHLPIKMH